MKTLVLTAVALLLIANVSASPLSRRNDYICGLVGTQSGIDSFITTSDGGYPACSSLCFSNSNCRSFAWNETECNLYKVPVTNNHQVNGSSSHFFYDRECGTARQVCGTSGYQSIFDSYWWSNSIEFATCVSTCRQDQDCRSYAYGNGECSLYSEPVTGNLDGVNTGSPYLFYDSTCPLLSSPEPVTIVQATATSSTSTTASNAGNYVSTPNPTASTTATYIPISIIPEPESTSAPSGPSICGLPGYDEIPPFRYTFDGDSYNHCVADCKADPDCLSFAFETDSNQCFLYDVAAEVTVRYNANSPAHFYDKGCGRA